MQAKYISICLNLTFVPLQTSCECLKFMLLAVTRNIHITPGWNASPSTPHMAKPILLSGYQSAPQLIDIITFTCSKWTFICWILAEEGTVNPLWVSIPSIPFHKLSAQSLKLFEPLYLPSNLLFVIIRSPQHGAPEMSYARHVVIEAWLVPAGRARILIEIFRLTEKRIEILTVPFVVRLEILRET